MLLGILSGIIFFALHVTSANSFPKPLSSEEERECFKKMKKGDEFSKNKLIEHNLRLVAHIIKKYYSNSSEQDDLVSVGTIGLIKAVSTFNYEKGTKFATYAAKCIENEILMYFRNKKKYAQDVPFSEPIDCDKDGNTLSIMDIMADEKSVAEDIEDKLNAENLYKAIDRELLPREKEIIYLRYGLMGSKAYTQREVAKKLGISRSYVSRIEKKAIETLKCKLNY
ncbi:MAG: RNA polymerase sporulation sigma factor SigK [Oscillospiraceae bacterium]|nr:RNA polymerase sporulation sigma factor SigK [Oscillospiraceae bacterium]